MALNVTPFQGFSYDWKGQWSLGTSQSSWTTLDITTGAMVDNHGVSEGEYARFGNTSAEMYEGDLKYMSSGGGWHAWTSLACDMSQQSITNWDAVAINTYTWRIYPGAPAPGDC
jgi:hypothetical protein